MPIQVQCQCGNRFLTRDENAGRRALCPECGNEMIIPGREAVADILVGSVSSAPEPSMGDGAAHQVESRTSGMAIASLVLGICSFLCTIVTGIPAIIVGSLGLSAINKSRGAIDGQGLAIAGIVMGSLSCALFLASCLLLIPARNAAREAARRTQCISNLKQITLAMQNYHDVYNVLPPAWTVDADGKPLLSWRVLVLPFLGEDSLYAKFKLDEPWDSSGNKTLLARMPNSFSCPSWPKTNTDETIYQVLIGPGTLFEKAKKIRYSSVTDGPANTLIIVESTLPTPWTQPSGLDYTPTKPIPSLAGADKLKDAPSAHRGGFNAAFADGSVKFIKNSVAARALEALATRNGDEPVAGDSF